VGSPLQLLLGYAQALIKRMFLNWLLRRPPQGSFRPAHAPGAFAVRLRGGLFAGEH
jgi:hypothetical protein